jgi:hypothetical protein
LILPCSFRWSSSSTGLASSLGQAGTAAAGEGVSGLAAGAGPRGRRGRHEVHPSGLATGWHGRAAASRGHAGGGRARGAGGWARGRAGRADLASRELRCGSRRALRHLRTSSAVKAIRRARAGARRGQVAA